jgi:glucose dehydrogenase/mono/diheme cytochrome c family protein
VAVVAALGLAATAAACSGSDGPAGGGKGTGAEAAGARTYATTCATCHGVDGAGGQGPAIGDGAAARRFSAAEMVAIVHDGRGNMPPLGTALSDDQIRDVVAYVRDVLGRPTTSTTTGAPTTGPAGRGSLSGTPPEVSAEGNWALPNGDYRGSRTAVGSPITAANVDRLAVAWTYRAPGGGTFGNFATNPLIVGDTVYVGDLTTKVHAVDRRTGAERFVAGEAATIFGPTGVAVAWGRIYGTTADAGGSGTLVAAWDARTGKRLWATSVAANKGIVNVQPVAYDGLVFASTSGYGAGTRATIYALDAETGAIVWSLPVIEDEGLWGHPELNSGGGVWYPPAIDTGRRLAYFGTGNPYPFPGATGFPNGSSRPGDNRWTDSTLAVDLDTGKLAWGRQAIAHDIFDRDAMIATRVDATVGGKRRALTISTGKLGVVTALDADSGEVVWSTPVGTHQNDELTAIDGPTTVYPGSLGGVQTPIASADGTVYATVMNAPTVYGGPEETSYGFTVKLGTADSQLVALDAATGAIRWSTTLPGDALGGATVVNDLVFTSAFDGTILALRRGDGAIVWRHKAPGGINGWPAVAGDELVVPVGMADPPQLLAFRLRP